MPLLDEVCPKHDRAPLVFAERLFMVERVITMLVMMICDAKLKIQSDDGALGKGEEGDEMGYERKGKVTEW